MSKQTVHITRETQAYDGLDGRGRALVLFLPSALPLCRLSQAFPHVVNRLARVWYSEFCFSALMDELLFCERPQPRKGFPYAVCQELLALRDYHATWLDSQASRAAR